MQDDRYTTRPLPTELRNWATEWVTRIVADGGPHGPGSHRAIAVDNDTWHYLMDDVSIQRRLHELHQPAHRTSGRYAATYEQPLHGADCLHVYAVEYRDGAPPQRIHLAQPFRKLAMGVTRPSGEVIEVADAPARAADSSPHQERLVTAPAAAAERVDDSARYWAENYDRPHEVPWLTPPAGTEPVLPRGKRQVMGDNVAALNQPARPAADDPREGAVDNRPPRRPATPLWHAAVAGAIFFVALIVHGSYSGESSACTVSESSSYAYVYDTPACSTAFRATDTSRWLMIVAGAATVGLAGRRYLGR